MAAPTTTIELLDQVVALGLCDSSKLTGTFPADNPLPDSPAEVVGQLVRYGVCTKYQARMILAGKGRKLLLGKYRLLRPLGKGGGGSVFLGEHADIRRRVAVKVLRGGSSADTLTVERFKREARAAAALDHPNLVRLFDFGVSHGVPYLVMEYAPGKTLQQVLDAGGPLAVPAAVHVATQTAIGLGHAHARGIVHRDVKPFNLMASNEGQVKILDMGLARALDRTEDRLTEQADLGTVAGTIDFMPPEQCSGLGTDERTDIYALGATLFTLLSGRPVFLGTPAEKIAQHQTAAPPALDQLVPIVPPGLARVVEKMLAKRPADRFASCDEVVAALAPWCPAEPPPLGVTDPLKTVSLRTTRKSSVNWSADDSRRTAGWWRRVDWVAAVLVAVGAAFALGVWAVGPAAGPDLTTGEPAAELQLEGHTDIVNELVFTPDGTRLIGIDWSGAICVWDTATGRLIDRRMVRVGGSGTHVALTPSGRALVCGNDMPTVAWDLDSGKVDVTYEDRAGQTWAAYSSPDGARVLIATNTSVAVRDAATTELVREFDLRMECVWDAAFSPDGRRVAVSGREADPGRGVIAVFDAATGECVHRLYGHKNDVRWVGYSPDGTKLASGGFDNGICVWDLATGACEREFTDANLYVERVDHLPNGNLLSVSACDHNLPEPHTSVVSVWNSSRPQSTPVWTRTFPGRATTVTYSPAAGLYAVANKSKQVWLMKAPPAMTGK